MVAGSLPLFGLSFLFEKRLTVQWNLAFIGILLALGLVGSAFTIVLWVWLPQKDESGRLSLYLLLNPVFAIIAPFAAFRQRLGLIEVWGVAFILAGIGRGCREAYL